MALIKNIHFLTQKLFFKEGLYICDDQVSEPSLHDSDK